MINTQIYLYLLSILLFIDFAIADDSYLCICAAVIPSIFGGIALIAFLTWLTCYCKQRTAARETAREEQTALNIEDPVVVMRAHVQVDKTEEPVASQPVMLQVVQTVQEDDSIVYPVAKTS